jgi:hypothetical protein
MIAMAAFPPVSLLVTTYAIIISFIATSVNSKVTLILNFMSLFSLSIVDEIKEKSKTR